MRALEAGAGLPSTIQTELLPAGGVYAKSKAQFTLDLALKNTGPGAVDAVLFVSPDALYTLAVHLPTAPEAWTNLMVARGPGFAAAITRPSWIIKVRFAPGAIGHTQVAAKALTNVSEHQSAPGGTMMRWVVVEQPLPAGHYTLRVTDMIRGEPFASSRPNWLTVEP